MAASASSRLAALLLTTFLVVSAAGCKKSSNGTPEELISDDSALLAGDGTDSFSAEADAQIVTTSLISPSAAGGSLALIGDSAKAIYFPRSCLTVTSDSATKTVTYVFDSCAGPNGILKLTGTMIATYEVSPDKLVFNITGTNLIVNQSTVDWSARAEVTASGAARTMVWHGTLSGETARGKAFDRTNDSTLSWRLAERCLALSGVSEGHVRGRYLRTDVTDFKRCQGSCPEAGGRITISNEAKVKVEIRFDGTSRATYATPKGSVMFDLACKG